MYKFICLTLIYFIAFQLPAQYKNDNVLYKTVYPEDLGHQLRANPGYLLLDVRSKGENQDTSSMQSMNIGHLKNARNIDVRELGTRLNKLQGYKNSPVFVYCSHSQRSRRASKMLADSGFTNVYNINGGMTTLVQKDYGINTIYQTKDNYQLLSPGGFCREINAKNAFIIDVRPDSSYNATTGNELTNSMGKIKSAVHIPLINLENALSTVPKDKKIIILDEYSDESIKAATLLVSRGYKKVAVLFDGMYNFITTNSADLGCKNEVWLQNKKYHILTSDEFNYMDGKNKDVTIVDTRGIAEYNNQSKDLWRNIGHIKNAINIPEGEMQNRLQEITPFKNKPVILYSFGFSPDAYKAAATLVANGFTNVNILSGGIFNLRWRAANIKGKSVLKDWVTGIPAENM
jgi:rhodanese-related sulfurtransferase